MVSEQTEDQYKEGLRLFKLKEYQQCIDIFSQILDVDQENHRVWNAYGVCLLYTSDAADDLLCVALGGRRIIKKKNYYISTH